VRFGSKADASIFLVILLGGRFHCNCSNRLIYLIFNQKASLRRSLYLFRPILDSYASASALPFTRVSFFRLSTVTCVSYNVRRGRAPKRSVSSLSFASVNHASAAARLSQR